MLSAEKESFGALTVSITLSAAAYALADGSLDLPTVLNLFPRLTCLLPYATVTATFGLMLGIKVGTTPDDLNFWTTVADDCAEMPTGEQEVVRFSVGVGAASEAVAARRSEKTDVSCIFDDRSIVGFLLRLPD